MECPKCGLISQDTAERCDCGAELHPLPASPLAPDPEGEPLAGRHIRSRLRLLALSLGLLVAAALLADLPLQLVLPVNAPGQQWVTTLQWWAAGILFVLGLALLSTTAITTVVRAVKRIVRRRSR